MKAAMSKKMRLGYGALAVAGLVLTAGAGNANAGHNDVSVRLSATNGRIGIAANVGHDHSRRITVATNPGKVWVPPVYETQERFVQVPAVYENVERKIWHEPVYEIRDVLVETPAEYRTVQVPIYSHGRIVGYDTRQELIKAACDEWVKQQVLVRAGFYETVFETVQVAPPRTTVVTERVCVREGYWASSPRLAISKSRSGFHAGYRASNAVRIGSGRTTIVRR